MDTPYKDSHHLLQNISIKCAAQHKIKIPSQDNTYFAGVILKI